MLKTAILALALLLPLAAPAQSQSLLLGVGVNPVSGGGGGYTGPVDVVTSTNTIDCWSLRACASSTRGNNAIRVCNPGDVNCADFVTDATTGNLVWQTLGAVNCQSAGTCTIRSIYGQMGTGCTFDQSVEAKRVVLKDSVDNGKPGGLTDSVSSTRQYGLTNFCFTGVSQPVALSFVYKRTSVGLNDVFTYSANQPVIRMSSANQASGDCGGGFSAATGATDNAIVAAQLVCNGGSSFININGTSTTVTSGSQGFTGTTNFTLVGTGGGGSFDGYFFEALALKAALSNPTGAAALGSNQTTYW